MNTWFRKVGMSAVALTLAGIVGGCNNGNGGAGIRLFFGINGSGSCNTVVVEMNLDDANAVIARDDEGALQCVLNTQLNNAGCNISFQEFEGGDFRATITGCTIPAVTNLFSCIFDKVDISDLQDTASAICSCTTQGCDGTPPVCISTNPDPTSCEICDNGTDDDGNGLVDCDDPNCENSPDCVDSTTTSTTSTSITVTSSTSSTSSTTTTSSTTSTTIAFPFTCRIVFRVPDDVTLGSLQWDTDYSDAPGFFLGNGGNVECASLIENSLAAFNDVDGEEILDSGLISLDGFSGPVNVSECTFKAQTIPVKDDFAITVTEASKPDLTPIVPLPDVIIGQIDCDGIVTTTLIGDTTTTTEPPVTTTLPPADATYKVSYTLASASGGVGALQWTTDYSTAPGAFIGSGALVQCTNRVGSALFAPNDVDATKMLTLGQIALTEFSAPILLADCNFLGTSAPVPGQFVVTIDDATNGNGDPITAVITVAVTLVP